MSDNFEHDAKLDRVEQALRHARHETGLKDVLSFSLGRAWSALQIVGAIFSAACSQVTGDTSPNATSPSATSPTAAQKESK